MNHKTIIDLFDHSVNKYKNNVFLWEKRGNQYEPTTYLETKQETHYLSASLIDMGVMADDKIALLSEGRNAWIISELAILHARAVNVPLSIKLEEREDLIFRLTHSETKYIFVSGNQLNKIRDIIAELPEVRKVIVLDEQEEYLGNETFIGTLIEDGKKIIAENPDIVTKRTRTITSDCLANIVYTSGTTADPKGVMLTHGNYTTNVEQAVSLIQIPPHYKTLLILPLDHCFAHVAGFYSFMASGASVGTVQVGKTQLDTLRNIPTNIKELKPNLMLSVPALAKNFKKNIENGIRAKGKATHILFNTALKISYSYNKEGFNKGGGLSFVKKPLMKFFDKILFSKIRDNFGGQIDFFIGGGAYLDTDLQRFYYAIGMPMYQGYGLSEATPVISSNGASRHKLGTSGTLVKDLELKICDANGKKLMPYEKGEIVVKGGNVMAGYFKNPTTTAETIVDGWLHTGDRGYIDNDGFLYVIGRFKSLLISSDGEKYSPEGIEEAMSDNSRFIDQVLLHNNQNQYTVALVVPNKEMLKSYVKHKKPHYDWESDKAKTLALQKIQKEINAYRKGGKHEGMFPERWLPAAISVIDEPFSEKNGLINSTLKVVRSKVYNRYKDRITQLYIAEYKNIINEENLNAIK